MTKSILPSKAPLGFAIAIALFGFNVSAFPASKSSNAYAAPNASLRVCSGYGCVIKDRFSFTGAQRVRLKRIMATGKTSPKAERKAVSRVIGTMERMARVRLGYAPDKREVNNRYNGLRGQMDCVDESLNTTAYLNYLHARGWLRYHKPRRFYAERGFILDGRYPHKSAVMTDKKGGQWAVDSWYGSDGQNAKVLPLKQWRRES